MCHLLTWYWHTRCQQKHSSLLQQPTKASKCQGCERGLSSDVFCCPTTDQVPDGGTKDHSDHLLGDPLCDHVLFSSAIRLFLLVVLLLDFINMCCISLEGLKWAFAPTSKYKNKHRSGEIFPVFFFGIVLWAGVTCILCLGPVGSAVILYCLLLCIATKGAPWQMLFLALISHVCCVFAKAFGSRVFPWSCVGPRAQTVSAIRLIGGNLSCCRWIVFSFGPRSLGNLLPLWSVWGLWVQCSRGPADVRKMLRDKNLSFGFGKVYRFCLIFKNCFKDVS